jgi:anti-sigma B factor antagonist
MTVPGPLVVEVERRPSGVVVVVDGELDISVDQGLRRTLLGLCEQGRPIILDLSNLSFCDVPGVRVFIDFARMAARRGVAIQIRGAQGQVDRLLDLTHARGVLPLAG